MKDRYPRRLIAIGVAMAAMFAMLVVTLANLQLRDGAAYGVSAESKKTKGIFMRGDRGMITDINSVILAQNRRTYNVCFYRDPTWIPPGGASAYGQYSRAIVDAIEIVQRNGSEMIGEFALRFDPALRTVKKEGEEDREWDAGKDWNDKSPCNQDNPYDGWYFEWGNVDEHAQALREGMWRSNLYVSSPTADRIFARLCARYRLLDTLDWAYYMEARQVDNWQDLSIEERWQHLSPEQMVVLVEHYSPILAVWQLMQMNAFLSTPITIAENVSWETVIEIETRSMMLPGISVAVSAQRIYPANTHMSHVIGYIGKIQSVEQYRNQLRDKGYRMDDLIGLDGIERSMEDWLTPNSSLRQGKRVVEIDRYGAVSRELEHIPPQDGNNVRLTIDSSLQRVAEMALEQNINIIRDEQERLRADPRWNDANKTTLTGTDRDFNTSPIKMAEKGAVIAVDMQGRVLALASYPPYDPNAFIVGGKAVQDIMDDERRPLMNYAIQSLATPGSIFKMVTCAVALATGHLEPNETISDGGRFDRFDRVNAPRCWIDPRRLSGPNAQHQNQTVVEGLQNSCNYFFYEVASRVGVDSLYKYSSMFGLTSRTNIELPGEQQSYVGNQAMLFDPTKAIHPAEQATWRPTLVKSAIKRHLQRIGRERNITFDEGKLDRAIKRLMEMAVAERQSTWVRNIRSILIEELDMSREMVYLQVVVGDIYIMLNEIRWGESETLMMAIGQSITQLTPAAVARYVAAVANGGTVYDLTLIDSITSPDGELINKHKPVISNTLPDVVPFLDYIHRGMRGVVDEGEGGTAARFFKDFKYRDENDKPDIAGKTGTAQVSRIDIENNAWFVAYAPYDNPEIAVVCYIPNGYGGGYASHAARLLIEYYLDNRGEVSADLMPAANSLAY
ncbi:MAG: penicillin-binding transpeptidase domain-containing protein [Clostridia bacterium]|nr:penicillin-binding transpeptidase domain-containing protein [Clostridia bacterium]